MVSKIEVIILIVNCVICDSETRVKRKTFSDIFRIKTLGSRYKLFSLVKYQNKHTINNVLQFLNEIIP